MFRSRHGMCVVSVVVVDVETVEVVVVVSLVDVVNVLAELVVDEPVVVVVNVTALSVPVGLI